MRCMKWLLGTTGWLGLAAAAVAAGGSQPVDGPQYVELKPAFVTNFGGPAMHFLKAELAVRVNTAEAAAQVEQHGPQLRHALVMLLSDQTAAGLESMEGKEALRHHALAALQDVFEREAGAPVVEDVLFNNLILQR